MHSWLSSFLARCILGLVHSRIGRYLDRCIIGSENYLIGELLAWQLLGVARRNLGSFLVFVYSWLLVNNWQQSFLFEIQRFYVHRLWNGMLLSAPNIHRLLMISIQACIPCFHILPYKGVCLLWPQVHIICLCYFYWRAYLVLYPNVYCCVPTSEKCHTYQQNSPCLGWEVLWFPVFPFWKQCSRSI